MIFNCSSNKTDILLWSSSPYLLNLVTRTMIRRFACSGMLPVQYTRFVKGVKIDLIQQWNIDKCMQCNYIKEKGKTRKVSTRLCEGCHEDKTTTVLDVRHGLRKNAKDCSVVAKRHIVIKCEEVAKQDDINISERNYNDIDDQ